MGGSLVLPGPHIVQYDISNGYVIMWKCYSRKDYTNRQIYLSRDHIITIVLQNRRNTLYQAGR